MKRGRLLGIVCGLALVRAGLSGQRHPVRVLAVLLLAVGLLGGAAGAPASVTAAESERSPQADPPRSGWSGAVVGTYASNQRFVGGGTTRDLTTVSRIDIQVENSLATATATYKDILDETYNWNCGKPDGRVTYTWATQGSGRVGFGVQRDETTYTVNTSLLETQGTLTTVHNGHDRGCNTITENKSQPFSMNVNVIPFMKADLAPGITLLSGSRSEPIFPSPDCGNGAITCTGETTATWSLVRTKKLELKKIALFDRDPLYFLRTKNEARQPEFAPLQYLSASPHPWFTEREGTNPIYATVELDGFAEDAVKSLTLEVQWGDRQTGAEARSGVVYGAFVDAPVTVSKPEEMFVLPASGFGRFNQDRNGKLTLRVKAVSAWGDEVVQTLQAEKLVRYSGTNRYGGRDPAYGGDSWVKPHVRQRLEGIAALRGPVKFLWGDLSNMNGGRFYPHKTHRTGLDADAFFAGYYKEKACTFSKKAGRVCYPTEYAAKVLLALLRTSHGRHIAKIFVTFKPSDAFGKVVTAAGRLPDGRQPSAVIRNSPAHDTHFHILFKDL